MKKFSALFLIGCLVTEISNAQVPHGMNYQAVARNSGGGELQNQPVGLRFSIRDGSITGNIAYRETQTDTTNQFGIFSVVIGDGAAVSGNFSSIAWGSGAKFLQVELDPAGGSNYTDMGTTQLVSVPYALLSENVVTPNYPASASDTSATFLAQTIRNTWVDDPDILVTVPETGKYLLSFYGNMFNNNETLWTQTSYDSDGEVRVFNMTAGNEIYKTSAVALYFDLYSPNDTKRKYNYLRPSRTIMVNLSANDVLKLQYRQFAFGSPLPTGSWYIGSGEINILRIGN